MNKQTRWTLGIIGAITVLASVYAYFIGKDGLETVVGGIIGIYLIVLSIRYKVK